MAVLCPGEPSDSREGQAASPQGNSLKGQKGTTHLKHSKKALERVPVFWAPAEEANTPPINDTISLARVLNLKEWQC